MPHIGCLVLEMSLMVMGKVFFFESICIGVKQILMFQQIGILKCNFLWSFELIEYLIRIFENALFHQKRNHRIEELATKYA